MEGHMVCLDDFEAYAERHLAKGIFDYFMGGSGEEITLRDNRDAFNRWKILPRVLRDVSRCDMTTSVLGHEIPFPICMSPSATHKMAHEDGEVATATAASALKTIFTLSTFASCSIEEVASKCPENPQFFQLYVFKDRALSASLIRRAEAAGYSALVVTVDVPVGGNRRAIERINFKNPTNVRWANFDSSGGNSFSDAVTALTDPSLTWDIVKFIRSISNLPIILKGIMTVEDAKIAVEAGVDGIFVSNHGGRQLDTIPATIDVLPEIVAAVNSQCEIYVDGGIRTGTDIFKALALGARAVFIGRPVVYGLAFKGSEGVRQVLEILRDELASAMALAGCSSISDVKRDLVIHQSAMISRL